MTGATAGNFKEPESEVKFLASTVESRWSHVRCVGMRGREKEGREGRVMEAGDVQYTTHLHWKPSRTLEKNPALEWKLNTNPF